MATPNPTQPNDPAKLGADRSPEISHADDSHDMSPVLAEADKDQSPDTTEHSHGATLGSSFARQRQQGAEGDGTPNGDVGQGQGMGRAGYNGDEDRTYDQNTRHGGLGSSGGREDHTAPPTDNNSFTGNANDQPSAAETNNLGLNTPSLTSKPE